MAIGDVDGDGKPDIIVTNQFDTSVSVYRNTAVHGSINGSSFEAPVRIKVAMRPIGIIFGDLDGDGQPDIAVTNYNSFSISVLRNTSTPGTISFETHVDFTTGIDSITHAGSGPFNIAAADINSDGKPDLVVANDVAGSVSVFQNQSSPGSMNATSFTPRIDIKTGDNPFVTLADIDGDGNVDIITANWGNSTVSVLRNIGTAGAAIDTGTFAPRVNYTTGSNPFSVATGDLDGDGKPDLIVSNESGASVSILRNLSTSGSISFASKIDYTTGSGTRFTAINDLDGDGKPDIATCNRVSNTVSVFKNNSLPGSLLFAAKVDFTTRSFPRDIAIGDLDGDKKPDLLIAEEGSGGSSFISVFRNTVIIPPIVTLSTASLNFGNQRVGTTGGPLSVILTNSGGQPLTIDSIKLIGDFSQTNNLPAAPSALAPESSGTINITFTPIAANPRNGMITVYDNGVGSPHTISLSGTGTQSTFSTNLSSVSFVDVFVNATKLDSITVSNPGTAVLSITSVISDNAHFSVSPISASIAPGGNQKFYISFQPTAIAPYTANIFFMSDAPTSPDTLHVNGNGVSNISIIKLQDTDGNSATSSDQTPLAWLLSLYKDSVSSGTLISSANTTLLSVPITAAGMYIASEADSGTSWNRINGNHLRYDTLIITSSALRDTFINFKPNAFVIHNYRDSDGALATSGDRALTAWHIELRKDSLSGTTIASGNGTTLTVHTLGDGTYFAVEADSLGWNHLGYVVNGIPTTDASPSVSITVSNGQSTTVDFINFHPNTLTVKAFQDNDNNLLSTADRAPKNWHLEIRQNSLIGPLLASGNGPAITANNLGDGPYVVVESDSTGWIHLGYLIDNALTSSTTNSTGISLVNGQAAIVEFVNSPPVYSKMFRSFKEDSIALDKDNLGTVGKFVKRKADKDEFVLRLFRPAGATTVSLKFSMNVTGTYQFPETTLVGNLTTGNSSAILLPLSENIRSVIVHGRGNKGKKIKTTYSWDTTPKATKGTVADSSYNLNQPELPMPNRVNALYEAYALGGFLSTGGLRVGKDKSSPDSTKFYGWLTAPTYADVLKSLRDKTGLHIGSPRGFDNFTSNNHPLTKRQKTLPPSKFNNILLANMVALRLNVTTSALGITPAGFGELIYNDTAANSLNGKMIKEISSMGDSLMMGYYQGTTHKFDSLALVNLNYVIAKLNAAFEGAPDTISFADSLMFKGTKTLGSVSYLRANPGIEPARIIPLNAPIEETPVAYHLYQNYPNPFNPATTIQFDLAEQSVVTLKIYNILGQEIATLIDHQTMDGGTQDVQFDANSVASGVYFYELKSTSAVTPNTDSPSQQFISVKKMLLMK
jgi:hypothetical protein